MKPAGEYVYLNGEILPANRAAISPFDVGLLRGYAVFDLLQTIGGKPFMLAEHLSRFRHSARTLNLPVPAPDARITEAILELLARNGHEEATIRLVLTGGYSPDGMHYDPDTPTFFILTHELFVVPEAVYAAGAKLITREHRREFPEAKTTNYLTWLHSHPQIEDAGALDVLYHADGLVSEAATASFYVVRSGRIFAPSEGVLWGTVGTYVLDLAKKHYEVVFGDISLDDALAADEAFLTSSVRGVVPVTQLDDRPVGDGRVGTITKHLMRLYREAVYTETSP
jgi:branched-chain amino acid aminotransferase